MRIVSDPMVSVVVPCYNGEQFIGKTLASVLNQTIQDFEIIVMDDGSDDGTALVVKNFKDSRIHYVKKENSGVSDTRNKGLQQAKGKYVLFLDADDLLVPFFLSSRVNLLESNQEAGFCGGKVVKIDDQEKPLEGGFKGASKDVLREILLYDPSVVTCPSGYLIRKSVLLTHKIFFHPRLSSTADRYFLIELSQVSEGVFDRESEFLYRVNQTSMSHRITVPLVEDNELFYNLVKGKNNIPPDVMRLFSFKICYILGAAYLSLGVYKKGVSFLGKALVSNPGRFSEKVIKKLS